MEVGRYDYLQDTTSMEAILLYSFHSDDLGDDAHITNT